MSRITKRIFVMSAVVTAFLASTAVSHAQCARYPDVPWWGKLSHEGVEGYVSRKHGGNWAGYLDKWRRQLSKVKSIHGRGQEIRIPSTGQILEGQQLNAYIVKLDRRIGINECLAQKKEGQKRVVKRKRRIVRYTAANPYAEGIEAYKAGDYYSAHDIWLPLAKNGNLKAQNALGFLYRRGLGVEADMFKARQWYGVPAASGNPVGQFGLGDIIRETATSEKEMRLGISLIEKAARQNYPAAQYALGKIFKNGEGVTADSAKAYFWTALASKNNYRKAKALFDHLDETLPGSVKQVELERAESWLNELSG